MTNFPYLNFTDIAFRMMISKGGIGWHPCLILVLKRMPRVSILSRLTLI